MVRRKMPRCREPSLYRKHSLERPAVLLARVAAASWLLFVGACGNRLQADPAPSASATIPAAAVSAVGPQVEKFVGTPGPPSSSAALPKQ